MLPGLRWEESMLTVICKDAPGLSVSGRFVLGTRSAAGHPQDGRSCVIVRGWSVVLR